MDGGFGSSGDEHGVHARGGLKWVMVIPVAVKLLIPSWLFILSDVKVRGHSVHPCIFGGRRGGAHGEKASEQRQSNVRASAVAAGRHGDG